jgi:hypothetical protein
MDSTVFTYAFALGTAANAREARGTRLAAHLHVQAAEADLSTAAHAVSIFVDTAVHAAQGAAESDVLLVDSVVSRSFSHGCSVFFCEEKEKFVVLCCKASTTNLRQNKCCVCISILSLKNLRQDQCRF